MDRHRRVWIRCSTVLALTGGGLGVLLWSGIQVLVLAFVPAVMAALVTVLSHHQENGAAVGSLHLLRATVINAVTAGACVVAVMAWLSTGVLGWFLVLLAGATCPWVVGSVIKHLQPNAASRPPDVGSEGEYEDRSDGSHEVSFTARAAAATALSDRELCHLWRASYWQLQEATSAERRGRVVSLRQAYLDEMERRNPAALGRWLASNPRPVCGLDRFLGEPGQNG